MTTFGKGTRTSSVAAGHVAAVQALLQSAQKIFEVLQEEGDTITTAEFMATQQATTAILTGANTRAQLAIETRLGEIVEQLRISNALRGTGHMGVLNSDAELRPARDAVRRLLDLEPSPVSDEEARRVGARLSEKFSDWVDVRAIGIHHGSPEVYAESAGARMLGHLAIAAVREASRG